MSSSSCPRHSSPLLSSPGLFSRLYRFPPSLCLPPFFLLTYSYCLFPPLSPACLLIPPLHPNLNSLKPSIRLHNKLLPLQARQGSSLPVAFQLHVCVFVAPMCVCVCVRVCLLASQLVSFHACVLDVAGVRARARSHKCRAESR